MEKFRPLKPTNGEIPDLTGLQTLRIGANSINENKFFYGDVDELEYGRED